METPYEFWENYTNVDPYKESIIKTYFKTKTMTKNTDVKPAFEKSPKTIFREIIDYIRDWNEEWMHYYNNSDIIEKPLDADQIADKFSEMYDIEEK